MSVPGSPPPPPGLTLRVLVPRGELPHWLGDVLLGLDALRTVRLQLQRVEPPPGEAPLAAVRHGWERRQPALRGWAPDTAARASVARWEAAATAEPADVTLSFDARLQPPARVAAAPAAALPPPPVWTLCDDRGGPLAQRFPLLRAVTAGEGVRLHCLQFDAATGRWLPHRTLHVPASSRYREGLATAIVSMQRLVQLAVADRLIQNGQARGEASGAQARRNCEAAGPRVVPATRGGIAAGTAACLGLRGRCQEWLARQRRRWISEYWRIGVIDAPIGRLTEPGFQPAVRWITADSRAGYWADPFGLPDDPSRLACEFFDEKTGVGHLELLQFGSADRIVARSPLGVGGGRHVSFPAVFELDGRRLGLAETIASRECLLHEVDADGAWRPLFPILRGVAAADPALFRHDGRFWLAYTDADLGERDNLCLRHAERLEGPWQEHANNPVKVDVTGARMAGNPFWHGGALYRPAQDCLATYGAAVVLHRVTTLTPSAFEEVPVRRLAPDAGGPCPDGLHTLTAWGERTLIDGKRHGVNLVTLRRKLGRARAQRRDAAIAPTNFGPAAPAPLAAGAGRVDRVFVYVPHLRMGGGETSMLRLAHGLAQTGLAVDLVVHTLDTRELALPAGVQVLDLGCGGTLAAVPRLAAALREHRPRWLLSAFPHTNIAAVAARALSRTETRCVITEHAPLSQQIVQQGNWRYRLLPPLLRWFYRRADAVVAVSNGVRDDLQALVGLAAPPVVIRNPVLPPDFSAESAREPDHPWLLDPQLETVLSVCRLGAEKDLPTLLHAFAEVRRTRPAARLLVAGDGPERAALEALITTLGLGAIAQLPGRTDQPLRWMRRAAVFVLASRFEGFGNVLVEAMACGTPVVATDCPVGPREVLAGGRWGALVPVGDVAAMAAEIHRALDTRAPPAGAREAALHHTEARACAAYRRLFESLPASAARC